MSVEREIKVMVKVVEQNEDSITLKIVLPEIIEISDNVVAALDQTEFTVSATRLSQKAYAVVLRLYSKLRSYEDERRLLIGQIEQLRKQVDELKHEKESYEERVKHLEQELEKYKIDYARLKQENEELKQKLAKLQQTATATSTTAKTQAKAQPKQTLITEVVKPESKPEQKTEQKPEVKTTEEAKPESKSSLDAELQKLQEYSELESLIKRLEVDLVAGPLTDERLRKKLVEECRKRGWECVEEDNLFVKLVRKPLEEKQEAATQ